MGELVQKILLIEDSPSDAALLEALLGEVSRHLKVALCPTLADGLRLAASEPFSVAFLDLSLPDSRGLETVRRAVAALRGVPVVVLTGLEDEEVGLDSLRAGAQDYLIKGHMTADTIGRSARYAIQRHQILRDLHEARERLEDKVRQRTVELARTVEQLQQEVTHRLAAEAEVREAQLEVLRATEREQRRIGRDLHDGIQGTLVGLDMMLKVLDRAAGAPDAVPEQVRKKVREIAQLVQQAIQQTRWLSRGLCPVELAGTGLMWALRQMAATTTSVFGVTCRLVGGEQAEIPDELVATQVYYIIQEAVTNALKHARCRQIEISAGRNGDRLVVRIADDGVGIAGKPRQSAGLGLKTMSHRARVIHASLKVGAGEPGGTVVELALPLGALAGQAPNAAGAAPRATVGDPSRASPA